MMATSGSTSAPSAKGPRQRVGMITVMTCREHSDGLSAEAYPPPRMPLRGNFTNSRAMTQMNLLFERITDHPKGFSYSSRWKNTSFTSSFALDLTHMSTVAIGTVGSLSSIALTVDHIVTHCGMSHPKTKERIFSVRRLQSSRGSCSLSPSWTSA